MEDEGACEDGFLTIVGLICCLGGYKRDSDDRLRGGSCGLDFSFGFVATSVDMVKDWTITCITKLGKHCRQVWEIGSGIRRFGYKTETGRGQDPLNSP